ncbi:MAG: cytochrome C [Pseudomonadota bacterium]
MSNGAGWVLCLVLLSASAHADSSIIGWFRSLEPWTGVAWEYDDTYIEECLPCHFPYQPGLLPERSWRALMAPEALLNHFGEALTMDEARRAHIVAYLVRNAADHATFPVSEKIAASLSKEQTPLRITETRYFRRKHHPIPPALISDNPKVARFSNCSACHNEAIDGNYDDATVSIPGYGRWTW